MTTPTSTTIQADAHIADQVMTEILQFMPFISIAIGLAPGGGAIAPLITEALTVLDNAAKAVAGGNTNAALDVVFTEIMNHLTPGKPNSPILSSPSPIPDMPPAPSGS